MKNELLEFCRTKKLLFIYGAGHYGEIMLDFLKKEKVSVTGFCVTQIDENNTFLDYPVQEIAEIHKKYKNVGIIVAVSERFGEEILEKVEGLQYFYDPSFLRAIELEKAVKEAEERTKQVQVENNFLCRAGNVLFCKDITYILCPGSIGDTLYVASLVKAYKQKNGIHSVSLILKNNQESIAELFASIDGSIVSDELVEILDLYFRNEKVWELDNYRYGFARKDLAYNSYMPPYVGINLLSAYKVAIMGLEENVEYEEMQIGRNRNLSDVYSHKTVILMPHESSARRLPLTFWEELAQELGQRYEVYTNIKDETELAIKGTLPVSESLKDMAGICEQCFAVISIRTGMCDLLAFTKTNLLVLNTEQAQEAWNLKKVFSRDNIVNINCYDNWNPEKMKTEIMQQLQSFS